MEIRGDRFVDDAGRRLILRGVNLGGSSKLPARPDGRTHLKDRFYEGSQVSFVGRPFPLDEADEHFSRLKRWGQTLLRFLVTWEAIEHEGPGMYDEAYLAYVEALVEKAARHGVCLFIDPHQDVWSRWTGGDGAPLWTLELLGFEPRNFQASGAAMVHAEMGAEYPRMQWFSNYQRLGAATLFTLFFAGDDFAPGLLVQGRPVQDFLQGSYIAAMTRLAARLASYPNVLGFDSLNEPGAGWIGIPDLRSRRKGFTALGPAPTPWEALLAGEGFPTSAETLGVRGLGLASLGRKPFGTPGLRAWKDGETCIWRRVGVWDVVGGEPRLLEPEWFAKRMGSPSGAGSGETAGLGPRGQTPYGAFNELYLKPFVARFAEAVRRAAPARAPASAATPAFGAAASQVFTQTSAPAPRAGRPLGSERFAIFVEGVPEGGRPDWGPGDTPGVVNATHWYDALTLTLKLWTGCLAFDPETARPVIGFKAVRRFFKEALGRLAEHGRLRMGASPNLVGEFGLPFDLNGRKAFRTGSYRSHEKALAAYYDGLDANLLDATIWNYTADNSHEWGDGWNQEDLSVFCADEARAGRSETGDPRDSGGRALKGFVRPYAMAVAGEPLHMSFSLKTGVFEFIWRPDPGVSAPTVVFLPRIHYPRGFIVETEGCAAGLRAESLDPTERFFAAPSAAAASESAEPAYLELVPESGARESRLRIRRA